MFSGLTAVVGNTRIRSGLGFSRVDIKGVVKVVGEVRVVGIAQIVVVRVVEIEEILG